MYNIILVCQAEAGSEYPLRDLTEATFSPRDLPTQLFLTRNFSTNITTHQSPPPQEFSWLSFSTASFWLTLTNSSSENSAEPLSQISVVLAGRFEGAFSVSVWAIVGQPALGRAGAAPPTYIYLPSSSSTVTSALSFVPSIVVKRGKITFQNGKLETSSPASPVRLQFWILDQIKITYIFYRF